MFKFLFALFVLLPLAELYVLIEVGSGIGGIATILLCLLTAAIGGILVRIQGLQTLFKASELINRGEPPAEQVVHGLLLAFAGIMLFLPGFITDAIGFLLLIPVIRVSLGSWFIGRQFKARGSVIIEGEVIDPNQRLR